MSSYIGKRVFYPCYNCKRYFTIDARTVEIEDGVLCNPCSKDFKKAEEYYTSNMRKARNK